MGAFTAEEAANVFNSILDFNIKGRTIDQIKQARPLVDEMTKRQKTFPGGKDVITTPVRGSYTTTLMGFSHDDEVAYANPANTKRASYNWKELHCGIQTTLTELKHAGISIVDSARSERMSNHPEQDVIELTNIFQEKTYDMMEGSMVDFAKILLRDGSADPTVFPGITSLLTTSPSTGTTGGIDRSLNSWYRNRADMALSTTTPSDMAISRKLQQELRQLRRYKPDAKHRMYAGSDFIDAWEQEFRAKGLITQAGWNRSGKIDPSVADVAFKGVELVYEPFMDDESMADQMLMIDHDSICLYVMSGEDWKEHNPARPHNKYTMYRALTWTGGIVAKQLNSSGRYGLA